MKAADLSRYMRDPGAMDASAVAELSQLVKDFPYFQPAHLLLSLASRKWDAAIYQRTLKKTAIVATSRTRLFELISATEETAATTEKNREPLAEKEVRQVENDLLLLKVVEQESENSQKDAPDAAAQEKSGRGAAPVPAKEEVSEKIEKLDEEIERQVVTSYVEKKMMQTSGSQKPERAQAPASFGGWLAYMKKNNGQPYHQIEEAVNKEKAERNDQAAPATPPKADRQQKNKVIIDSIIEKNPGHIRIKEEPKFFSPDSSAKESLLENEHLVTETLARIFALQGSTGKAIRAYQILSLKYPQKSAYFAGLIQQLKNNNKTG